MNNKNKLQKKYERLSKIFNISNKALLISGIGSAASMAMFITSPFTIVSAGQSLAFLAATSGMLFVSLMTSVDINDKLGNIKKQLKSEETVEESNEEEAVNTITEEKEEVNQFSYDYDNAKVVSVNNIKKRVLKPNKKNDND